MNNYITTGKVIEGSYIDAPKASGKPIDVPISGKRVLVELDGVTYERTIYHRVRWANLVTSRKTLATFVIIDGTNYEVTEEEDWDAPEPRTYQRYELEAFLGEPDDFDVDAIEAEVRDRWGLFADDELAEICMAHLKTEADC